MVENKEITVIVDVMSGDNGPLVTIPAVLKSLEKHSDLKVCLVGQAGGIRAALSEVGCPEEIQSRIQIEHAQGVVSMEDMPGQVLRKGKDTSMAKAIELLQSGQGNACVSAGNTGALMATAKYRLKTVKGIKRPAICAQLPTHDSFTYMLDLGAEVAASSDQLSQYASMGAALVSALHGVDFPSIGILNIGEEHTKGTDTQQEAAEKIKAKGLNYIGFVEGTDLYTGDVDVVVTDGFSGNIALKSAEGMATFVLEKIQQTFAQSALLKFVGWFVAKRLKHSMQSLDPRQHNGATLLGLNGLVIKSHGNADVLAFEKALDAAYIESKRDLVNKINEALRAG